jgi:hypothetical protein
MPSTARLELRIEAESKALIERAAELTHQSVTAFATGVLVAHARGVIDGPVRRDRPRPIGGWSFALPDDWDAPLLDLGDYR